MTRPLNAVDICNLALDHIGQSPISNITDPQTSAEETCARWYDHVRRTLLREYVWNFAKARVTCARNATPAFDWADSYALPNDFIRFLSVGGDVEIDQEQDYDIQGRNVLMNNSGANSINLRYIQDVDDPLVWDSLFTNIMALTLALRISYKFTLKKGVLEQVNTLLTLDLPKAISVDGQERPPRRIQRSKYLAARRRGNGYGSNVADAYTVID